MNEGKKIKFFFLKNKMIFCILINFLFRLKQILFSIYNFRNQANKANILFYFSVLLLKKIMKLIFSLLS